jgi:hypothetical protein
MTTMALPLLLKNHFQLGYAVKDIDKATEALSEKFGLSKWQVVRLPEDAPSRALAWAYVKDLMIELVDVRPGRIPCYDAWVPECESAARLHHLAYMVENEDEWRSVKKRFDDQGTPMVVDEKMGDIISYRYFDTVQQLGHYSEFVLLGPRGKRFWANVPHN